MFVQVNPNPANRSTGDCVIRALSILLDKSWDDIYLTLSVYGFMMKDWGSSNGVWERYILDQGFRKAMIPDTCPDCYTFDQFCKDTAGDGKRYLLATGQHVATVINGILYDSWDSRNEIPIYYYYK